MTRIVEHRSALPFGTVVEVHVHRGPVADTPMLATVNVTKFSIDLTRISSVSAACRRRISAGARLCREAYRLHMDR